MNNTPDPPDDLQFDKAQYDDKTLMSSVCQICRSKLSGTYFNINQSVVCPACKEGIVAQFSKGSPGLRVAKAFLFGVPAAVLGAVIYYAIVQLTHYEIGLVALVIAFLVGKAVRKGSEDRGGLPYQIIAVVLTYISISSFYFPWVLEGMEPNAPSTLGGFVTVFILALATPFMMGLKNVLGFVIIGFAVFEAWRLNQKAVLNIQGPFTIKATSTP